MVNDQGWWGATMVIDRRIAKGKIFVFPQNYEIVISAPVPEKRICNSSRDFLEELYALQSLQEKIEKVGLRL
jgi:hypothetical protein